MLIGKGGSAGYLDENDILALTIQGFQQVDVANKRVLVIIPDSTRTAPIPAFFRAFYQVLLDPQAAPGSKVASLDYLVALGTHQPLSEEGLDRNGELAGNSLKKFQFVGSGFIRRHRAETQGAEPVITRREGNEHHCRDPELVGASDRIAGFIRMYPCIALPMGSCRISPR